VPNPTYLSLEEAARKYGVKEKVLTQLIADGIVQARTTPSGELLVVADKNGNSQEPRTKEEIIAARFAHLRSQSISAYGAQKKYGIHHNNFLRWARLGYISILNEAERSVELDEAAVAYCAYIYNQKKQEYGGNIAGVKIFDENGNPYQVKYPEFSVKRRM
jgi:predicted site-specific integrase-resolvase